MPIETCRNTSRKPNNREEIVNEYDLIPVSHIQLLPNQTKENCCGGELENTYYVFSYVNKSNPNDTGHFNVGEHCARDFLNLINCEPLPLFNILTPNNPPIPAEEPPREPPSTEPRRPIINRQLEMAMNLFIAYNDISPFGYFLNILNFVRTSNYPTNERSILEVNRVIGRYNQTIPEIINELNNEYPNVRNFDFIELHNHIINNNILPQNIPNNLT